LIDQSEICGKVPGALIFHVGIKADYRGFSAGPWRGNPARQIDMVFAWLSRHTTSSSFPRSSAGEQNASFYPRFAAADERPAFAVR